MARGLPCRPPKQSAYLYCWDSAILGGSPLESGKAPSLEADPLKRSPPPSTPALKSGPRGLDQEGHSALLHPQVSLPLGRLLIWRSPIPQPRVPPECPIQPPPGPPVALGLLGHPCSCSPSSFGTPACPGFSSPSLTASCLGSHPVSAVRLLALRAAVGGCGPEVNMTPLGSFCSLFRRLLSGRPQPDAVPDLFQGRSNPGLPSCLHPLQIPQCWGGEGMVAVRGQGRALPTHLLPTCCSLGGPGLPATRGLASECHSPVLAWLTALLPPGPLYNGIL